MTVMGWTVNSERILSMIKAKLWEEGVLTQEDYLSILALAPQHQNAALYEISAIRKFGVNWAQQHMMDLVPELMKPDKKIDSEFDNEYDLLLDRRKIEVKASRAVRTGKGTLLERGKCLDDLGGFRLPFQQVKAYCCDVFVCIGVWLDGFRYWVIPSDVICSLPSYTTQHRGNETEGMIMITHSNAHAYHRYECCAEDLKARILSGPAPAPLNVDICEKLTEYESVV